MENGKWKVENRGVARHERKPRIQFRFAFSIFSLAAAL
jgi:hypothetical protein